MESNFNNKNLYLVINNILQKKFNIYDNKKQFINDYYEIYFKFKIVNNYQIELISDMYQNENLPFTTKLMFGVAKNMFPFLIKKHQIYKLKKEINFNEDVTSQLKHNKVVSYLYKDIWYDLPKLDTIITKITG